MKAVFLKNLQIPAKNERSPGKERTGAVIPTPGFVYICKTPEGKRMARE
jgi:hypothetical protein